MTYSADGQFWNLRSYDRINTPWNNIREMEKRVRQLLLRRPIGPANVQSGVTFHEAQVALAKVYVGSDDIGGDTDEVVNIERPHDERTSVDQIGKKDTVKKAVRLPKTVEEAQALIEKFQNGAIESDKRVYVFHASDLGKVHQLTL